MAVYDDRGIPWCACESCGFSGDILELYSQVRDLPTETSLEVYASRDRYRCREVLGKRRNNIAKHRRRLQNALNDTATLSKALVVLGLAIDTPPPWVGAMRPGVASDIFDKPAGSGPLIYVELERLPRQTAGGWVRGATLGQALVGVRQCTLRTMSFHLGAVVARHKTFLATDDMNLAMDLQFRSYRESRQPAPVVGLVCGKESGPAWAQLQQRIVFWSPKGGAGPIREAIAHDCDLTFAPLRRQGLSATGILQAVIETAQHWTIALRNHLAGLPPAVALALVEALTLMPNQLQRLADGAAPALQALLRQDGVTHTFFQGRPLVGSPAGMTLGTQLVCDATLRTTSIEQRGSAMIYTVEIEFRGRKFRRQVKEAILENQASRWLRRVCVSEGLGAPFVQKTIEPHLAAISCVLGMPSIRNKTPRNGWNQRENTLVVAEVGFRPDGGVRAYEKPAWRARCRAKTLDLPVDLTSSAVQQVSESRCELTFAMMEYNIACLLHGKCGTTPRTVNVITRRRFAFLGRHADAVGMPHSHTTGARHEKLVEAASRNRWGHFVAAQGATTLRLPTHGILLATETPRYGAVRAINSGEGILFFQEKDERPILEHGVQIMLNYLKHLASTGFQLPHDDSLLLRVRRDLAAWWEAQGGSYPKPLLHEGHDATIAAFRHLVTTPYGHQWSPLIVERGRRNVLEKQRKQIIEADERSLYVRRSDLAAAGSSAEDLRVDHALSRLRAAGAEILRVEEDVLAFDRALFLEK